MTALVVLVVGLGVPGVCLLIARWLAEDDTLASIDRHRDARSVLAELSDEGPAKP